MKKLFLVALGLVVSGTSLFSSAAQARVTIPESCLVCRYADTDHEFMRCLNLCLNGQGVIGGTTENSGWYIDTLQDALWAGWTFNKDKTFATLKSENKLSNRFAQTVQADITLSPHHGKKGLRLRLTNENFDIIGAKATFQVDNNSPMTIEANRYSGRNDFWTDNQNLLRQVRHGHTLRVSTKTFGGETFTFHFNLDGVRAVMDTIWKLN